MEKYFLFSILFLACSPNKTQTESTKTVYCPLNNFCLGMEADYYCNHMFEAEPTPCEKERVEKSNLFAIHKKGYGLVEFEGKQIRLKPSEITFKKGTLLWSQTFISDSLNIKFYLENYKLINSGHHNYYKSKLSFNFKDSLYQYEMKGRCNSSAISKLLKE